MIHSAFHLEHAYDSDGLDKLDENLWPEAFTLLRHFAAGEWLHVYGLAATLVERSKDPIAQAFVIQWAVAAAETEYNPARREQMLGLWAAVPNWMEIPYCRYLRAYQDALTRFFAGALRDASISFQQAHDYALAMDYERGVMRCLFHLGLVEKDRGSFSLASEFFREAHALATCRGATRYAARIAPYLAGARAIPAGDSFVARKAALEQLLIEQKFSEAKNLLLQLEVERRRRRYGRKRESIGIYIGLIYQNTGRVEAGARLLARISDPVLKLQMLQLKGRISPLGAAEAAEVKYLQESLGAAQVVFYVGAAPEITEVGGVRLDSVKQESVRRLLLFLLQNPGPQTKEAIASHIWGVSFDPTVHDKKVYKLILQTKKALGIPDLFLNTYGAYEIHPRLLGRLTKAS